MKAILHIITYWIGDWLFLLEIGEMSISVLHAALVPFNFKLAEMIYDNIVEAAFHKNELFLHETFK